MSDKVLIDHLKEFHAKADTNNFNVLDFVSAFGNPLEALAYSYLFWPDFVEFEGMIFLKALIEDEEDRSQIRRALARFPTRKEVEQSFNQFVIPDSFFSRGLPTTTDEETLCLAQRIAEMWEARLARLFPSKKCVVEVQSPEETNEGLTIVVYQA
jgi:hypothetical protein